MQFTRVRLVGRTNINLQIFGLRSTDTYILKEITGLEPTEIDVRIDGGVYHGRVPQDREIVIRLGLNPNVAIGETAASMRSKLYGLLTPDPTDLMYVQIMNGTNVLVQAQGAVKKIEAVQFTKDPEVQITVACLSPYLTAPDLVQFVPPTNTAFLVPYAGDVVTGFYMDMNITAAWSSFTLWSETQGGGPRLRLNFDFLAGDVLKIDTRKNQKSVKVHRAGQDLDVIAALSADSVWFQLHPGDNSFWTGATPTFTWGKFLYSSVYWGV